jgi:predicted aminopeptidase
VFSRLVAELRALGGKYGVESSLAAELDGRPNNARLASLATYYECVPGFQRVLAEQGHDLPRFYDAVRALAKLPRGERRTRLCAAPAADPPGAQ